MMRPMPTETLTLRKFADGYFRADWTDVRGKVRRKSFGKDKRKAQNRFAAFHTRWQASRAVREGDGGAMKLRDAFALYETWADAYYRRPDGTPTGHANTMRQAMAALLELFGDEKLEAIDASHVKLARDKMILNDLAVSTINTYIRDVRSVWRWFVEEKHASALVWHEMQAIRALAPGRALMIDGEAVSPRVTDDVPPVPDAHVHKVCGVLPLTLRTMVMMQYLTGARPGEVCLMRPIDIDTTGSIWLYKPHRHKTQHHRKVRVVAIGPRAQAWLKPILERTTNVNAYLFNPKDAWSERMTMRRNAYEPKKGHGDYRRWRRVVERDPNPRGGDVYDERTYARAIERACVAADVDHWSPNQLRHNAATRIRQEFGIEAAGAVLGHSKMSTTEVYAKLGLDRAISAMERVG